jgi:hypothetical protein
MKSISDSPSMALSPSASVHSHLFAIFILAEIIEMEGRERTIVDKIKKW